MKAIEEMQLKIEQIEAYPEIILTDEELGLDGVNRILPDTWKNISFLLVNSIEELKHQAINSRCDI